MKVILDSYPCQYPSKSILSQYYRYLSLKKKLKKNNPSEIYEEDHFNGTWQSSMLWLMFDSCDTYICSDRYTCIDMNIFESYDEM